MKAGRITLQLEFDASRVMRQMPLIGWRMERAVARMRAGSERAREARVLAVDRKHEESCGLDIQIVTMSDGVTRVVSKAVGGWAK